MEAQVLMIIGVFVFDGQKIDILRVDSTGYWFQEYVLECY
jgi:hypothetical protein